MINPKVLFISTGNSRRTEHARKGELGNEHDQGHR
jgi:hypothetical protein